MLLEAVCGCEVEVPLDATFERSPLPGLFVRLRVEAGPGLTTKEAYERAAEILAEPCDACVEL